MNENSENLLVEQPAIALFEELGYRAVNAFREKDRLGPQSLLGRESTDEVVLVRELRKALRRLNPTLPDEALRLAIEELTRSRALLDLAYANREVYRLLKDGVPVRFMNDGGEETDERVRVIDWQTHTNNDFLLVSQLWITSTNYLGTKRPDLIGYVNGLPLVFCELKTAHRRVEDAYNDNFSDYKVTIPHLFWYNALVILSNGKKSLIGSITASLEHFFEWKRIESEDEEAAVSLETMIRGTCEPHRLLDIVENFTLFSEESGGLRKIVARNHQYLGVNNAIEAVYGIRNNHGRLGVFWHTQGSGKSYSMIFFSQKVLRKIGDNWTFVIVTDRDDLDDQIYKNFARAGAITEPEDEIRAADGEHLKTLLRADHRIVFTLIQKFRVEKLQRYPVLSTRSNIIVMTDEAHRSQYDTLAANMRVALPNAAFIGFTGTPLIQEEEQETREVFGDYVSVYNFRQSIEDGTTVPLYYENRIPEVEFINQHFNEEMEQVIDEAGLDEQQEQRLSREFAREYSIITSDDRLEKIAEDIVKQFMGRVEVGDELRTDKAMVVSIDKMTTVRMYNKVRKYWRIYRDAVQQRIQQSRDKEVRASLQKTVDYMDETDMAVILSQSQNEITLFKEQGLDIASHRQRMMRENLEEKFKSDTSSLRIVFVCAMWITGFDVPSLSTIYLDKPMKNHTLMQTIARANRVFQDKSNGLIVDYVGIFRNLQKALAIYGKESNGSVREGDMPVRDKNELLMQLRQELAELIGFCQSQGFDPNSIVPLQQFARISALADAEDALLVNDEVKREFLNLSRIVIQRYKEILPDERVTRYKPLYDLFVSLVATIRLTSGGNDISQVMKEVGKLVDTSIAAKRYIIRESVAPYDDSRFLDLSKLDIEALRAKFENAHKHTEAEKLRSSINSKLNKMIALNKGRINYREKFEQLIADYNEGRTNVDIFYEELLNFVRDGIQTEEQRHIAEHLSEEELAVFDMLLKSEEQGVSLTKEEREQVKNIVHDLLETLKREKLVLDWRKKQQARAAVKQMVRSTLRLQLPATYPQTLRDQKENEVYQHIFDSYEGEGRSIYAA